jgi:hypothetical protein
MMITNMDFFVTEMKCSALEVLGSFIQFVSSNISGELFLMRLFTA